MPTRPLIVAARIVIAVLMLGTEVARAQYTPLSGSVYDGAGGPLVSGTVYHAVSSLSVPAGKTLTAQPGAILKFASGMQMTIDGTLAAGEEAGTTVVFSSVKDDTAGGDTNGDGASSGAAGDWYGLVFNPASDASALYGLDLRFACTGFYGNSALTLSSANITMSDCVVRNCLFAALDLTNTSQPVVEGCSFLDNGGVAVRNAVIEAVPGFVDNVAAGNAGGNYIDLPADATAAFDLTIASANCLSGVLVVGTTLGVAAGVTVRLEEGVIIKFRNAAKAEIEGTLDVQGTALNPVVITSFGDDTAGGDTNHDGPSTGTPGDWVGMYFQPSSDQSTLSYLEVRYAGYPFYGAAGITLVQSDAQLDHCTIRNGAFAALDLSSFGGAGSKPAVNGCSFLGNGGLAVDNVMIDAVPGFAANVAAGNASGNYIEVSDPSPDGDVTISAASCLNGALVFATGATIPAGIALTLQPGVIVKWRTPNGVTVYGSLNLLGTAFHPVVLTSFADDAFGGDTNVNGPSAGIPGDWESIRIQSSAGPSLIENAVLRYGGYYYAAPMLSCPSASVTVRSLRAEHGLGGGIEASAHPGDAENWVAVACSGIGIHLTGGTFNLVHASAAMNGGIGIRNNSNFQGQVLNSIGWLNAGGNYGGFTNSQLSYCDGSAAHAGSNGNINVDPLFVDASGDLRLQPGSPCINTANALLAPALVKDHQEYSRLLDAYFDGSLLPDMGAYEYCVWTMNASGEPRIGAALEFKMTGPSGRSYYLLGAALGYRVTPWGYLGAGATAVLIGNVWVGFPLSLQIPDDLALVGTQIGVQTITMRRAAPGQTTLPDLVPFVGAGNVTNLYRATILP